MTIFIRFYNALTFGMGSSSNDLTGVWESEPISLRTDGYSEQNTDGINSFQCKFLFTVTLHDVMELAGKLC